MPQMSPLMWELMLMSMVLMFTIMMIKIYNMSVKESIKDNLKSKELIKMNFLW